MKKILLFIVISFVFFTLTSCGGDNYPGKTETEYWLSSDNSMMFYFPAEAGHGKAVGLYLINDTTVESLILEWDTITGVVEVQTAGYEKMFTANTFTDRENLTCVFEITSLENGYNLPSEIIFYSQENVNFYCINNIHSWSDDIYYLPDDNTAYYHCVVCGENKLVE